MQNFSSFIENISDDKFTYVRLISQCDPHQIPIIDSQYFWMLYRNNLLLFRHDFLGKMAWIWLWNFLLVKVTCVEEDTTILKYESWENIPQFSIWFVIHFSWLWRTRISMLSFRIWYQMKFRINTKYILLVLTIVYMIELSFFLSKWFCTCLFSILLCNSRGIHVEDTCFLVKKNNPIRNKTYWTTNINWEFKSYHSSIRF